MLHTRAGQLAEPAAAVLSVADDRKAAGRPLGFGAVHGTEARGDARECVVTVVLRSHERLQRHRQRSAAAFLVGGLGTKLA